MTPRCALLLCLGAAAAGCGPSKTERVAIDRWLLCEECAAGELDSVLAIGNRAVGVLGRALTGPPRSHYENVRRQALAYFDRLQAFAGASVRTTREAYVSHYVGNYVATYQSRAAVALAGIGTPRARSVLHDALRRDSVYRSDVRRTLGGAVGASLTVVSGDNQIAPRDSFVLNPLIVGLHDTTGQALEGVRVRFVIDSGGGRTTDSIQRTDANGGATVRWQLGPVDSTNVLRAIGAGQVVRFHALGRPPGVSLVFTMQPTTTTAGAVIRAVRIEAQDDHGNTVTSFNGNVNMTIAPGTGAGGAVLSGTTTVAASNGVGVFANLRINLSGTDYQLMATAPGLTGEARSVAFDIN
jgi:hypothetical protein